MHAVEIADGERGAGEIVRKGLGSRKVWNAIMSVACHRARLTCRRHRLASRRGPGGGGDQVPLTRCSKGPASVEPAWRVRGASIRCVDLLSIVKSGASETVRGAAREQGTWPSISRCRSSSSTITDDGPHHPQPAEAARLRGCRRRRRTAPPRSPSCASKKYGLVISDWNMEPMTGYELLQGSARGRRPANDALHHGDGRIEDRERHRRQEGRREQLHRQAVQRPDLKTKIEAVFGS